MSKELHIALQEAIGDLGTNVLKSPFLVNILQDYGAFDVHDKKKSAIKSRLSDMIAHRHIEEVDHHAQRIAVVVCQHRVSTLPSHAYRYIGLTHTPIG